MLRKLFKIILIIMIIMPTIGNFNNIKADFYDYGCAINEYEVAYILDDGTFQTIDCKSSFDEAKTLMKTNKDYVVRDYEGYSPNKIVAMNSGLVYAYPRGTSGTMKIYEDYSNKDTKEYTYISRYYEMTYIDTPYMSNKAGFEGQGYVEVVMNGFKGYADIEYTDLVPSKFIDNKIAIYMGGPYSNNTYNAYSVIPEANYYELVNNGSYVDLVFHYHVSYPENGVMGSYSLKVDNGEHYSFLEKGKKYFSDDGFNFYTDYYKTTYVGSAYNYYQVLPARTKTDISASSIDNFLLAIKGANTNSIIKDKGQVFIDCQNAYGFNATLLYSMACLESAYGTSNIALGKNNLFGWNAYDDSPSDASSFSSVDVCIKEQMGRNLRGYLDVFDSRFAGSQVGNKGFGFNLNYASDPYWGQKIAAIYYNLDKYSNNNNGQLTDYDKYTIGVVKTYNAGVYADQNLTNLLYRTANKRNYQNSYTVVILEKIDDVYKIQTSNPIENNELVIDYSTGVKNYNFDTSIAYIKASDVEILYEEQVIEEPKIDDNLSHEVFNSLRQINFVDNILTIEGIAGITNVDFVNEENIKHYIEIYDQETDELKYSYLANNIDSDNYSLNDGFDYKFIGYKLELDLSKENMDLGSYYLKVKVINNSLEDTSLIRSSNDKYRLISYETNDINYRISTNHIYNYRLEMDIDSTPIDYSIINKPSTRTSLAVIDELKIEDNKLNIKGHGLIYYLNYENVDDIKYEVYLIENKDNYKALDTNLIESQINWKLILNSSFEYNNICFEATLDNPKEVLNGDYKLILKIINGENVDYVEFANRSHGELLSDENLSFYTSDIRDRIMVKVVD